MPISKGDYRLGPELYRKKLLYDDMVEMPLDRLLQIGYDDLHKNQAELKRVAALIDPSKTPEQILATLEQDHPKPDQLLQSFRDTFNSLIGFIQDKKIITIPSDIRPIVQETPPFARALSSASMETPGPYETKATEAFFNVTLPEPSWTAEKTKSWMEGFNRGTILSTAIHEAYPGHYEQFLWGQTVSVEDAQADRLRHQHRRLGALHRADDARRRLRQRRPQAAHRTVAGRTAARCALHRRHRDAHRQDDAGAGDDSSLSKKGHQTPAVAEREAQRGTSDPTYLVYTLGKLQIMKLRADYKQKMGASFTPAAVPRRIHEAGHGADSHRAAHHAGQ